MAGKCVRCGKRAAQHEYVPLAERLTMARCPGYVAPAPIRSAAGKLLGALTRRSG